MPRQRRHRGQPGQSETAPPGCRSSSPGEVQFQQNHEDLRRMKAGVRMSRRRRPASGPSASDFRARGLNWAHRRRRVDGNPAVLSPMGHCGWGDRRTRKRRDRIGDVARFGHQNRAILEQAVGSRPRADRAASPEQRTPAGRFSPGQSCADQRARALGCLDHDKPERQSGDDPVSTRKILRPRLPAEGHFGDDCPAAFGDLVGQLGVF